MENRSSNVENRSSNRVRRPVAVFVVFVVVSSGTLGLVSSDTFGSVSASESTASYHPGTVAGAGHPTAVGPATDHPSAVGAGPDLRPAQNETGNLSVEVEASIDCTTNEARIETDRAQRYNVFVVVRNRTTNESRTNRSNLTGPTDGATVLPFRGEGLVNVVAINTSINASEEDPTVLLASRVCGETPTPQVPVLDCDGSEARVSAPEDFRYGVGVLVFQEQGPPNSTRTNFTTGNATVSFPDLPEQGARVSVSVFVNASSSPISITRSQDGEENLTVVSFARVNCVPSGASETTTAGTSSGDRGTSSGDRGATDATSPSASWLAVTDR